MPVHAERHDALIGQAVDAQWVVIDAGGPQGLAFSRCLEATILP